MAYATPAKAPVARRRQPVHPDDVVQQVEEIIAEQLPPDSGVSAEEAYVEIIEVVETAPRKQNGESY